MRSSLARWTGAVVLVILALLLGTSIVPAQLGPVLEPTERVVVGLNVRAEPNGAAPIRAVLRPGDRVTQIGEAPQWVRVRLADGTEGWAFKAFLRVVTAATPTPAPAPTAASGPVMRVHLIDVGQGAATLLEFPCAAVLIDTGGEKNDEFDSVDEIKKYLATFFARRPELKGTLHGLILTHPHVDHTRGVPAVLEKYRVLSAATNGQKGGGTSGDKQPVLHQKIADTEETKDPSDDIRSRAVRLTDVPKTTGMTDVLSPVTCPNNVTPTITALWGEVLENPGWPKKLFQNENNHSVVTRVQFGSASMLITGDLQEDAIADLITRYDGTKLLDVDVYQVGHHGSHNATTDDLLKAMTPAFALIAMGPSTREFRMTAWKHGHPRKDIVDKLVTHVSGRRPMMTVDVATAVEAFVPLQTDRAIYATGWDGSVVLEADLAGAWKVSDAPTERRRLINLNTATAAELVTLPMIGQKRAEAIARERTQRGPFSSVDDMRQRVSGIGAGTVSAIRPLVTTETR